MENASLIRRVGAMIYDTLLLFAILMLASVPFVIPLDGEDMESTYKLVYQLAMVGVIYAYFAGYWTTRGRTLGMQSWGLQVVNNDGRVPSLGQSTVRFLLASIPWAFLILYLLLFLDQLAPAVICWALAGLSFTWQLWDKGGLALQDRFSGTRIVHIPRNKT